MLDPELINQRLQEMSQNKDVSTSRWPENCDGSRKVLVIFVGPSPGGKKENKRRDIRLNKNQPYWDKPYNKPWEKWSGGFKTSFNPLIKAIFREPYSKTAKLIARFNMDWLSNPESKDVSYRYMWEGCSYILPVLYECNPDLVIPMDEKTFGVLQIALYNDQYEIVPPIVGSIKIKISGKDKARYHRHIMAYTAKKGEKSYIVVKSLQHPARIYSEDYAKRVGESIREAAIQITNGDVVSINKP